jgi:heat shock protein HslJ
MDGYRLPILLAVLLVSACTITSVSNDAPNRSSRLDGSIWTLLFIDDDAAPGRPLPTLEFVDDGNVRGFAGCNRYHGILWTSGDRMRFLDVGHQLTGCEQRSAMELEARYLKALSEVRKYRFDSGKLALLDAKRNVRIVLKRSEFTAMRAPPGAAAVIGHPVAPGGAYASSSSGALPVAPYIAPPTILHQEASPFPGLRAFGSIAPAMPASSLQSVTVVPLGRFTGVELVTMTSGLGKYFGVERGVLISRLPAVDALLIIEEGDVLLSINGRQPANAEHAARILSSYRNGELLDVQIMRQQKPMTLKIAM